MTITFIIITLLVITLPVLTVINEPKKVYAPKRYINHVRYRCVSCGQVREHYYESDTFCPPREYCLTHYNCKHIIID